MKRYFAFLRGMNLGRRRVTNDELCHCFSQLGLSQVSAFLASGNVIFDHDGQISEEYLEEALARQLGYPVPTFLRTGNELQAIAQNRPFGPGNLQVALLRQIPSSTIRTLSLSCPEDQLTVCQRELYWQPQGGLSESKLKWAEIEAELGPTTIRTHRTMERLAARFL